MQYRLLSPILFVSEDFDMNRNEKRPAEWWLPEHGRDRAIPGSYEVCQDGSVIVELHRQVPGRNPMEPNGEGGRPFNIMHGIAMGLSITLLQSREVSSKASLLMDHATIVFKPWISIEGVLLDEGDLSFSEADLKIENQEIWTQHQGFVVKRIGNMGIPASIERTPFETVTADVTGGTVAIKDSATFTPSRFKMSLSSNSRFHIVLAEPVSIGNFVQMYVRPLLLMMVLATGRDCGVASLEATSSNWVIENQRGTWDRWITVRMGKTSESLKDLNSSHLLFSLQDLDWEKQARHVFDVSAAWQYPIEQWATLTDSHFIWPLGRFANAIQAVEALDRIVNPEPEFEPDIETAEAISQILRDNGIPNRTRSKVKEAFLRPREPSLEARLARLAMRVDTAMSDLIGTHPWHRQVARIRHVASHGLANSERFVTDVRAPQVATEILLHLLECLFLERLGFAPSKIVDMQKKRALFAQRAYVVRENIDLLDEF